MLDDDIGDHSISQQWPATAFYLCTYLSWLVYRPAFMQQAVRMSWFTLMSSLHWFHNDKFYGRFYSRLSLSMYSFRWLSVRVLLAVCKMGNNNDCLYGNMEYGHAKCLCNCRLQHSHMSTCPHPYCTIFLTSENLWWIDKLFVVIV